jgi:large conductance mechanosensitive channel
MKIDVDEKVKGFMGFFNEFKKFAMRGNVIDLAVAVVIGTAFGKIVTALVDGIIMPVIGVLLGGVNIADKTITLGNAVIKWGAFLQSVVDFTIIAFSIFLFLKLLNTLYKKEEPETKLNTSEKLLIEIRDLLKNKNT